MDLLFITPPFTQLNTPYPATTFLKGYFDTKGIISTQKDVGIELFVRIFQKESLTKIKNQIFLSRQKMTPSIENFIQFFDSYESTIEHVIQFLQGNNPTLAMRIVNRNFLPEGPSFSVLDSWEEIGDGELLYSFGTMGIQDKAKYFCSLYINDLCQVIQQGVDKYFSLSKYGERLAASYLSFDEMYSAVNSEDSFVGQALKLLIEGYLEVKHPKVVAITVPFPGNLFGALLIAKFVKSVSSEIKVALGGGYINTELRNLHETRLFQFVDYISLDDGEKPLENILKHANGEVSNSSLIRTFILDDGKVAYFNDKKQLGNVDQNELGVPTYSGINLNQYLSICEMLNPAHRIWSDGRWNKLMLAHGCYWRQCSFCDVSLDYIERYQESSVDAIIQRIKSIIVETGQTGFHFVDEAAPPKLLFALAKRLIDEKIQITWWGNIRFEKSYSQELTQLLADSGCIAVTGGLEVASDRLLKLMKKGVTLQQAARVTHNFSAVGILVHTYLMYGFPSQTEQETIDSLEVVRQLFVQGCVQSAYWHRFAATVHSPVGLHPENFGVMLQPIPKNAFARNDIDFVDSVKTDFDLLGIGLKKALYNYMLGIGLDEPLDFWFNDKIPMTRVTSNFIEQFI